MNLTEKMKLFCQEYSLNPNATQAAIKAGYSPHSAPQTGSRLLNNANVLKYIDEIKADRYKSFIMTSDQILAEITFIVKSENIKIKDKLKALDLLSNLLGLKVNKSICSSNQIVIIDDIG